MNIRADVFGRRAAVGGWLFFFILIVGGGCSRTASVTGKVTYQGRPVVHGSVVILGADKIARFGVIGSDGSYTVELVTPGEVKIAVLSRDPAKGRSAARGPSTGKPNERLPPDPEVAKAWFPLPQKYEDAEYSGLGCTIGSGSVIHDLELH